MEHAVSEVYARTGTDRLKHGSSEEQPNWVHQSVSHGSYNDRLVAVVNANKLKAKTERNHCLVDKVSNEDGPNLKYSDTICLQPCAVYPLQHSIGYMADGFYRSKDPTNSNKVLKEATKENKNNTKNIIHTEIHAIYTEVHAKKIPIYNTASSLVYSNMG